MAKKIFNFGERLALYSDLPAEVQYNIMPEASAEYENVIIQYIGTTDQDYTQGYFYVCVSDGLDPATYSWEQLNIQPAPDMSNYEQNLNKVTSITSSATDTQYPSARAVYSALLNSGLPIYTYTSTSSNYFRLKQASVGVYFPSKTTDGTKFYYHSGYGGYEINCFLLFFVITTKNIQVNDDYGFGIGIEPSGSLRYVRIYKASATSDLMEISGNTLGPAAVKFLNNTTQSIDGTKTFTTLPKINSYTIPTLDTQFAPKKYVDDLIAGIDITDREIVQQLPTQDISTKTIYMVPSSDPSAQNVYEEYMYINSAWELIGSTSIDLSNYYTKSEVDAMITNINNQIGNIAEVLSHLTNPVIPIGTVLYTENVTRTVGNVTYEGTYTATLKEFHADTNYYVIDYTFENTGADDIPGAVFDEITTDPAGHLPLMAAYTIEAGETVTLTSYWQDSAQYAATEARYQVPGNVSVEFDTTDNTNNYTSNLALNKLDGFNTDVVAHVHTYDSSEIDEGWTHTTFDRTGGTEDPYTVPEPFYVAWINFDTQTFGVLSEPISDTLTMTRSYIGFNADQFDQNNVAFFLAKTADVADCTYAEFEAAYYDYTGGVN